ncbi:MAG: hypothetical protein WA397_09710 [Roseiarcus sp.]
MPKELEPSEAVRHAKHWLASIYADEGIENVGLEEVRWKAGNWEITLGFDRFTDDPVFGRMPAALRGPSKGRREYKVIVLSGKDNSVIEMRNREAMAE